MNEKKNLTLEVSHHTSSLLLISEININNCENKDQFLYNTTNNKSHFHIKISVFIYSMSGTISALLDIIVPGNSFLLAVEQEGCFPADGSVS